MIMNMFFNVLLLLPGFVAASYVESRNVIHNSSINYYKLFNGIGAYDNRLAPKLGTSHGMVVSITSHIPLIFLQSR